MIYQFLLQPNIASASCDAQDCDAKCAVAVTTIRGRKTRRWPNGIIKSEVFTLPVDWSRKDGGHYCPLH